MYGGEWKDGKMHGRGVLGFTIDDLPDVYDIMDYGFIMGRFKGHFVENRMQGKGKLI